MAAPLIQTVDLAKDYCRGARPVPALRGVTVTIERGEFVAVMGPSGSGKSTLLNLIGCLDRPTAGRYLLDGHDVSTLCDDELAAIRSAKIGMVFQNFNLLARTSAVENVGLPLLYSGVPAAERRQRALAILEKLGLGHRRDHQPSQLSGGEQQRVAIARALIQPPTMILADEPTGSLETRTSVEIMELFQAVNRAGMTIVLVTHDAEIARYANRIITFRDGRVVGDAPAVAPLGPDRMPAGEAATAAHGDVSL